MPRYQAMVERANGLFNGLNIKGVGSSHFADPAKDLGSIAEKLPVPGTSKTVADPASGTSGAPTDAQYLNTMPPAMQDALRSLIHRNLKLGEDGVEGRPYPIQFLWMPAAAWEMTICELKETATSTGGISVLLKSPIP